MSRLLEWLNNHDNETKFAFLRRWHIPMTKIVSYDKGEHELTYSQVFMVSLDTELSAAQLMKDYLDARVKWDPPEKFTEAHPNSKLKLDIIVKPDRRRTPTGKKRCAYCKGTGLRSTTSIELNYPRKHKRRKVASDPTGTDSLGIKENANPAQPTGETFNPYGASAGAKGTDNE